MSLQFLLVILVFLLAIIYIGRMLYKSISSKKGCASNCGKCAADFNGLKFPEKS
jgi:uncharacterized protein (UPF0333 family)